MPPLPPPARAGSATRLWLAALLAATAISLAPSVASAGGCRLGGLVCSQTTNGMAAGGYVAVAQHWRCPSSVFSHYGRYPCGSAQPIRYLARGQSTTRSADWDAFRIERGCTVSVLWNSWVTGSHWSATYYASRDNLWIRVPGLHAVMTWRRC
jgi:hypothetical protein